jgi:CRP-like cAMP-binding protein
VQALRSSEDERRANAAEALETLTSPQISRLLVPLFNEHLPTEHALRASRRAGDMPPPDLRAALRFLLREADQSGWRAVAALALAELGSAPPAHHPNGSHPAAPLARAEVRALLDAASTDPADNVRTAVRIAQHMLASPDIPWRADCASHATTSTSSTLREEPMLTDIERMMFLQAVPFFQGMTIEQLRIIATACEEVSFASGTTIITEGASAGALYVIVQGHVEITCAAPDAPPGAPPTHLATLEAHAHLGEMSLFDNQPASASAFALHDTLTLKLHREQVQHLCRYDPDLSLALIHALSQRLREANQRISELSHAHDLPLLTRG